MRPERLGATWLILERRYSCRPLRYSDSEITRLEKLSMLMRSMGEISMPTRERRQGPGQTDCVADGGRNRSSVLSHNAPSHLSSLPGSRLGAVHDDLLQPLQALLAQLLAVPDELGEAAVRVVLRGDLDELGEVVP
ncbi:hypothetical protein N308_15274, partial [Struthio camelus australis]